MEKQPDTRAFQNTDKEIWRGKSRAEFGDEDRFYADSLFIPASEIEALGINCGGSVIVKPIREWHKLALIDEPGTLAEIEGYAERLEKAVEELRERLEDEAQNHEAFARILEAGDKSNIAIGQEQIVAAQRRYAAGLLAALLGSSAAGTTGREGDAESEEHLESLIKCWLGFYKNLPDGEYKGLGEMRLAVAAAAANRNAREYCGTSKAGKGEERAAASLVNPPTCDKHSEKMALTFWDRPGSPPGNGWVCRSCVLEREFVVNI